jgi:hypothetical protein
MPTPGHFILHSRAEPRLDAGDYTLKATQEVAGGPTEPYTSHLRITSPRFRMPPDQILSTFPPANSEGAYESRLPQIVLRRRTLPWERIIDGAQRQIPWLALVVIAEGEGQLSGETPVGECITPGKTLPGPSDVATGVYLAVSETVVKKIFPAKEDLQLLAHVREVDLNDTELAIGDDDGFLAVVLANRLPQFDRVNCKPVRYMACLINIEGQFADLPKQADFVTSPSFNSSISVQDVRLLAADKTLLTDHFVMGKGVTLSSGAVSVRPLVGDESLAADSAPVRAAQPASLVQTSVTASAPTGTVAQSWQTRQTTVEQLAVSAAPEEAGRLVRDAMTDGFRIPIELFLLEKVYRFPVLAHWSFTCTGAGSLATLMQGLDVGLLGTLPADPFAKPKPDCAPSPKGTAPPPADPPRPAPELTETGHVGLRHLTRRGDALRAWYRGPFTLHVTQREQPDAQGHLRLAHTSDQLRRIVPDGREDLALAAAFEIGRLMALSQPSVVAALMRWRREQFGAERARRMSRVALGGATMFAGVTASTLADLGALAGKQFILEAAKAPQAVLAPARPLADAGRPLTYLDGNIEQIIAVGFGIPLENVRNLTARGGVVSALNTLTVPTASAQKFDRVAATRLRAGLDDAIDEITAGVVAGRSIKSQLGGPEVSQDTEAGQASERDALDELLDAAARAKETAK